MNRPFALLFSMALVLVTGLAAPSRAVDPGPGACWVARAPAGRSVDPDLLVAAEWGEEEVEDGTTNDEGDGHSLVRGGALALGADHSEERRVARAPRERSRATGVAHVRGPPAHRA